LVRQLPMLMILYAPAHIADPNQSCFRDILHRKEELRISHTSRLSETTSTTTLKRPRCVLEFILAIVKNVFNTDWTNLKAYIHSRMRRRTADFLQGMYWPCLTLRRLLLTCSVLNRARPENEEKERKTASGRTFRVQG
jgi:hypothetical protein